MTIVTIHQPCYWPWLGLCDKVAKSDVLVLLDNVDLNKEAYQHRNFFLCGIEKKLATIPLNYSLGTQIKDIKIADKNWTRDHLNKFKNWYGEAKFFDYYWEKLKEIYSQDYEFLIEPILKTMEFSFNELGIKTEIKKASDLNVVGKKFGLVLDICKRAEASVYLSGIGINLYMPENGKDLFKRKDITLKIQDFDHPSYNQINQINREEFIPNLGVLDLFFNEGPERSKEIFWDNVKKGKEFQND